MCSHRRTPMWSQMFLHFEHNSAALFAWFTVQQLPVKIRPLLRKFQVGLWLHNPLSPTGLIIEYTQTRVHTHAYSNKHTALRSPVVRRHWWRVLVGIISSAVLSHLQSTELLLASPPAKNSWIFLPNLLFLSRCRCCGSFYFLFPLTWNNQFCLFYYFWYFRLRPKGIFEVNCYCTKAATIKRQRKWVPLVVNKGHYKDDVIT